MESAPQSTINHNAVIVLPQNRIVILSPVLRTQRTPARSPQKERPQIGGDHAKVAFPAQRREPQKTHFWKALSVIKTRFSRPTLRNGCRRGAGVPTPCPARQEILVARSPRRLFRSTSRTHQRAGQIRRTPRSALLEPCTRSHSRRPPRSASRGL